MMLLFPRLPRAVAVRLAGEHASLSAEQLADWAANTHPAASFSTTGGTRISESALEVVAAAVRSLARECGYPEPRGVAAKDQFDGRLGELLHRSSGLTPSEACRDEVWNFFGCVLLPDVVRWRWPGDATADKNFLGKDRGIDNTFGRCWWAAELLRDDRDPEPYALIVQLGVDETVGFSRRARAITNRRVAVRLASTVVETHTNGFEGPRLELMRDAMKRFLRLGAFVAFEFLTDDELDRQMWALVDASARHLAENHGFGYTSRPQPAVAPRTAPSTDARDADAELSGLLAEVDVDSRGPNRFAPVKDWLGALLRVDPSEVAVKRLTDSKNYRNRVGEALGHQPAVVLLLGSDVAGIKDAIASRLALSPRSTVLFCQPSVSGSGWQISLVCSTEDTAVASEAYRRFPAARVVSVALEAAPDYELGFEERQRLLKALEVLPLGLADPVAEVALVTRRVSGLHPRTKRIVDAKNVGNRISEGLGIGAAMLVVGVTDELFDTTVTRAREQLAAIDGQRGIIIVAEDRDGCLASPPVLLGLELQEEEDEDEGEVEGLAVTSASEQDSLWGLASPEERSELVAEHLLFHGPLPLHDAVRLAAELMRDNGHHDYQRLRTNGHIYTAVREAIEFGIRTGDFDSPRPGEVRAILYSPDDFTREDWALALEWALTEGEPVARADVVKLVASWAKENVGLEYERIRRNGKIDKGVRNAVRTLLRRGVLESVNRDEVVLVNSEGS